jgi:hypothetical protein
MFPIVINAQGESGGLAILLNPTYINLNSHFSTHMTLSSHFQLMGSTTNGVLKNLYAPQNNSLPWLDSIPQNYHRRQTLDNWG